MVKLSCSLRALQVDSKPPTSGVPHVKALLVDTPSKACTSGRVMLFFWEGCRTKYPISIPEDEKSKNGFHFGYTPYPDVLKTNMSRKLMSPGASYKTRGIAQSYKRLYNLAHPSMCSSSSSFKDFQLPHPHTYPDGGWGRAAPRVLITQVRGMLLILLLGELNQFCVQKFDLDDLPS